MEETSVVDLLSEGRRLWLAYTDSALHPDDYVYLLHYDAIGNISSGLRGEIGMAICIAEKGFIPNIDDEIISLVLEHFEEKYDLAEEFTKDVIREIRWWWQYGTEMISENMEKGTATMKMSQEEYQQFIDRVNKEVETKFPTPPELLEEIDQYEKEQARIEAMALKVLETHLERIQSDTWQPKI